MLDKLKEIERIVNEDGASRDIVTSFESLVGSTPITKEININKFTSQGSNIFREPLIRSIQEHIEIHSKTTKLNHSSYETLVKAKKVSSKLKELIETIGIIKKGLDSDFWERAFNEKITIRYDDNLDRFINISEEYSVFTALDCGYDIVSNFINASEETGKNTNWKISRVEDIKNTLMTECIYDVLHGGYYPLLNLLKSESISTITYPEYSGDVPNIDTVTIRTMYNIINNDKLEEDLVYLLNNLERKGEQLKKGTRGFDLYSLEDSDLMYEKFMNIGKLLDCKVSNGILKIFEIFASRS